MSQQDFVAQNIRYLRKQAQISQGALAEEVGLNRGNIASYEKGIAKPGIRKLYDIAQFFEVDLTRLVTVDLSQPDQPLKSLSESMPSEPVAKEHLKRRHLSFKQIIEGLKGLHNSYQNQASTPPRSPERLAQDFDLLIQVAESMLEVNEQLLYQQNTSS